MGPRSGQPHLQQCLHHWQLLASMLGRSSTTATRALLPQLQSSTVAGCRGLHSNAITAGQGLNLSSVSSSSRSVIGSSTNNGSSTCSSSQPHLHDPSLSSRRHSHTAAVASAASTSPVESQLTSRSSSSSTGSFLHQGGGVLHVPTPSSHTRHLPAAAKHITTGTRNHVYMNGSCSCYTTTCRNYHQGMRSSSLSHISHQYSEVRSGACSVCCVAARRVGGSSSRRHMSSQSPATASNGGGGAGASATANLSAEQLISSLAEDDPQVRR